jgi:hypothetical protein
VVFLLWASGLSLQSYELESIKPFDVWLEKTSSALLARWLMEHRDRMAHGGDELARAASKRGPCCVPYFPQ